MINYLDAEYLLSVALMVENLAPQYASFINNI